MRQLLLCGAAIATLLVSACNGGGATGEWRRELHGFPPAERVKRIHTKVTGSSASLDGGQSCPIPGSRVPDPLVGCAPDRETSPVRLVRTERGVR